MAKQSDMQNCYRGIMSGRMLKMIKSCDNTRNALNLYIKKNNKDDE